MTNVRSLKKANNIKRLKKEREMKNKKLTNEIVKDLKQLAGSLESLAMAMESEENHPEEMMAITEKPLSIEDVRAVLVEKSQSGKQADVKALVTKYGAQKLTDINPSDYKKLLKEAEVL